jgi:6-phosphogluconate dehydrogenase
MIHNGIEYGLMQAYAEGFDILRNANCQALPEDQRFTLNLADISELWRRGSVVGSWLLDLTAAALRENPDLSNFQGRVSDSGEGRWTLQAAIDEGIPAPVISAALYGRFSSRGDDEYADRLLSAMRYEFGGHLEKAKTGGR